MSCLQAPCDRPILALDDRDSQAAPDVALPPLPRRECGRAAREARMGIGATGQRPEEI